MTALKIRSFRARTSPEDFLAGAKETAEWIRSQEVRTENGSYWQPHPSMKGEGQIDLMHGSAGILLFFIQLADAAQDSSYLEDAKRGAEYIVWQLKTYGLTHLQSGMKRAHYREGTKFTVVSGGSAGIAYALTELNRVAPDRAYTDLAQWIAEEIVKNAVPVPGGIAWSRKSGFNFDAGTALYLLYAAKAYGRPEWIRTATAALDAIQETGTEALTGGVRYTGLTNMVRIMEGIEDDSFDLPNFCYGSAGIGYAFARAYQASGEKKYLDAAVNAARYLEGIAEVEGDAALTPYRLPDLESVHYLSNCHGISGVIRLFYLLYDITGEQEFYDWIRKYIRGFEATGAPELHSNGYWNCFSFCCGPAGYADMFSAVYLKFREPRDLSLAERCASVILSEAHAEERGISWYQAFKRIDPADVTREIGYYSGAAGIGAALTQVYLAGREKAPAFRLLEEPYLKREETA